MSLTAGYLINTENPATNYLTGNEVHLDWLVGQHLPGGFALGLTGYWYKQVTNDSGSLPGRFQAKNFDASAVGIGLALLATPKGCLTPLDSKLWLKIQLLCSMRSE